MTSHPTHTPETREKLLRAAAQVFAEAGYRNATIRDICAAAGANVAAVNYHFGDKEALYREVLKFALDAAIHRHPPDLGLKPGATHEERLLAFVHSFLLRLLDEGPHALHGKLMACEMATPTAALASVVEHSIRPLYATLQAILATLLGDAADPRTLRQCAASVVGQCMFYKHGRAVIAHLHPELTFGPDDIARLARHITDFTLAGLAACRRAAGLETR